MHEDRKVCGSDINVIKLKSDIQARPSLLTRTLALGTHEPVPEVIGASKTYPFEIPVDYPLVVHID